MNTANADVTWSHIPTPVKMRVGAREVVATDEAGSIHFRVGSGSKKRALLKVVVRMNAAEDLYEVRWYRCDFRRNEDRFGEWARGIGCDQLGAAVERAAEEGAAS